MSGVRVRRRSEHRTMPWRNGGGVTHELACAGGDSGDFDWRVSIAEIESAGPFSAFPGVDRVITLLEGPWLDLTVDGVRHRLAPLEPFAFDGSAETTCEIPSRTVDLNVMCRSGVVTADVTILQVEKPTTLPAANPLLVVCLSGSVEVGGAALGPWDLADLGPSGTTLTGDGLAAVIALRRART